jgi:Rrf2 family protein
VKVSAKAEYACVAMVELAAQHRRGQPVQIKAIAEAHAISPRFLVQILLQLKGAGLVASSRGVTGGYQLTRAPDTISLADIVNTIDPSPRVPTALNALPQSPVIQALRETWQKVFQEQQRILETTTLAELWMRVQGGSETHYQI